jgi:hypothetical protein
VSSRETHCWLKISINLQMLLVAFTHLNIGLSLDTSLAINVEKYLMCSVGTRRPTVFMQEQQSILFLKHWLKIIIIITKMSKKVKVHAVSILIKTHATERHWDLDVQPHAFLRLAPHKIERLATSHSCCFLPSKSVPGTHFTRG